MYFKITIYDNNQHQQFRRLGAMQARAFVESEVNAKLLHVIWP